MADLLVNLAVSAAVVLVLLTAVYALSARLDRHDLIDTAWGLGFALIAGTTFALSSGRGDTATRVVLTVLVVVWGVRLAVHIGLRTRGKPEDHRYTAIRARNRSLVRVVYLPQGVIMLFVSLPVQVGMYATAPAWLLVAGTAVWLTGFVFESVGDWQLARFRADPANKGTVLDHGLWRYTRHPNYFGDAVVWWALYLLACTTWPGAATIPAPIVMTYLLARGTGKPLTEKHLGARPGYAEYVNRTSGFFPLPRRRGSAAR